MQTREVVGEVYPTSTQMLQGKQLINTDVTEYISEEGVKLFKYVQIVADVGADTTAVLAEYAYSETERLLAASDVEIKYHERGSTRAKLDLQTWYDYQEALRDYTSIGDGVYIILTDKPVHPLEV